MNKYVAILLIFISVDLPAQEKNGKIKDNQPQIHQQNSIDSIQLTRPGLYLQDGDDVEFANKVPVHSFLKDSVVFTLFDNPRAVLIDSLWRQELYKSSLYKDYKKKLLNAGAKKVVYKKLPTDTLKKRLAELDAKTPFKIEYNPHLENVIKSYLKRNKKAMEELMALSAYYFPMFEQKFAKYNVPLEIKYLAIVESALNPRARSWVGATGLWQFMYATGKMHGLEVNSYVDERMDPLKSTEAAAKYLSTLYKIFEDWDLVLASYNSGPGNVANAIRRSGGATNYWKLRPYLPRETANYVPAFIAIMYVFEYAEEHGFQPPAPHTIYYETDTVRIKKELTFDQIAQVTGVEEEMLQFLNPAYKLNVIPFISEENYSLRLPTRKAGLFVNNENEIYEYFYGPDEEEVEKEKTQIADGENSIKYRVKRGDYLGKIAEKYGVKISSIKNWNNLSSNRVKIDQILTIYPGGNTRARTSAPKLYTVKRGDSLWSISRKFPGLTVQKIKAWNDMSHNQLTPGMKLKLSDG
ncbi:MAG TPA: LysM peptidoglycan-binding domain-containing protein [Salinimicrobium sp.]|nr:LysM peptidoglycan-binding domain-containing protein [Salinimicrobium sp.]